MHKTKISFKDLGARICIIGPSNAGKSTLAVRLAKKMDGFVYHLDQLAHEENTNWKRRPDNDFVKDHDSFIKKEKWVIEGNYSICMPQRFNRSTAIIWLDPPLIGFFWRALKRSIKNDPYRDGHLKGASNKLSLFLIKHTMIQYPKNRKKYQNLLQEYTKPFIHIHSMQELNDYYIYWGLKNE